MTDRPKGIVWAMAAWGGHAEYARRFHLPSLAQAGNLPALCEIAPVRGLIFTRHEALDRLREPLQRFAAQAGIPIEAKIIPDPAQYPHGSFAMSRAQWDVARMVAESNEALVFTYPDTIVAADSYSHVAASVRSGARAVMWQGPTMREEAAEPFAAPDSAWAEVPYRDLLAATLNGLHPLTASRIWPGAIGWPSILHRLDGNAMTLNSFHPNPIYIWPRRFPGAQWQDSLDGTYTGKSGVTWDECDRLTAGGTFFWSEVAPDSKRERQGHPRSWDEASLKAWAIENGVPAWNQEEFKVTYTFEAPA